MNSTEKPKLLPQLVDALEDFALHDDVERRRRLVHDRPAWD